ncbi:MAG: TIGR01620 family protein [Rhizobiaceae bacterium]
MSHKNRAPRAFNLEETQSTKTKKTSSKPKPASQQDKKRKPRVVKQAALLELTPDLAAQRMGSSDLSSRELAASLTPPAPLGRVKRFRWSRVVWFALTALLSLGIGLWVDQLIHDLFKRGDWLGWLAIGLTGLLVLATLIVITREYIAIRRMAKIDKIRNLASRATKNDDRSIANDVIDQLILLYSARPDTARGRSILNEHKTQIIDGANLIALAERDLIKPLDEQARALVMGSAKRVSVVTAVSPRALVDIAYVLVENAKLLRQLSELYGGRPTTLGLWRLARNVIGHLALTGTIALGDGLMQQMVGHGLAAKISSKLGEGVINGLLTARIGISAIDICRPLPFTDQTRPTIKDFMGELISFSTKGEKRNTG